MSVLACPLDRLALQRGDGAWRCPSGHSYDVSRDGYVNLLPPGKPSRRTSGDDVESIHARRRFLDGGHFDVLARRLTVLSSELAGTGVVVDVGCGEGYYTGRLDGHDVVGLDLSRAGIRLAARRYPDVTFAVANAVALPILTASADVTVSAFAPVVADELARICKPGAHALVAVPAAHHLAGLRARLYATPRRHDEEIPLVGDDRFTLIHLEQVVGEMTLSSVEAVRDLVTMTPYRFAVPPDAIERALADPDPLTTPIEFAVAVLRRVSATIDADGESAG